MLKYFKKRKNFNRIKKLIKTKKIEKFTNITLLPLRTVYVINDTICIYQDDSLCGWIYFVNDNDKEVYLNWCDNMRLFDLAEEQYRFNNSV